MLYLFFGLCCVCVSQDNCEWEEEGLYLLFYLGLSASVSCIESSLVFRQVYDQLC